MSNWKLVLCTDCGTPTTARVDDERITPPMEACRCGSDQFEAVTKSDI